MLRFKNGLLLGTSMSGAGDGGGGGGGGPAANAAFLATLPEAIRGHESFKDVKDSTDLATRWHKDRTTAFADRLPEKYRTEAAFKDIKDIDGLAGSYLAAQKRLGHDPNSLVTLPKDANDTEGWNTVADKLGRPKSWEEYKIPPRGDGKSYGADDVAFQKQILPILHEAGIPQAMLERIVPKWDQVMGAMVQGATEQTANETREAATALRTKLGGAYDQTLTLAEAARDHLTSELKLGDALKKELDRTKLGNSPALFEIFAHIGKQLKEDGVLGRAGNEDGAMTPDGAKREIKAKEADKDFMADYTDKTKPGHANAVATMKRLFGDAYPGGQ